MDMARDSMNTRISKTNTIPIANILWAQYLPIPTFGCMPTPPKIAGLLQAVRKSQTILQQE